MPAEELSFCDHPFLNPVLAKLNRTGRQISNIIKDLEAASNRAKIICVAEINPDRLGYRVRIKELKGLSVEDVAMQVGECAHNLRSALDNMAYALARLRSDPPEAIKQVAFPIFTVEQEYHERWPRKKLEKLFDHDVADVITSIQPYGRDGGEYGYPDKDALHLLSSLNNADKHRLPNLVVFSQSKVDFKGTVVYRSPEEAKEDGDPNITFYIDPLTPGMTLLHATTTHPIVQIQGEFNVQGKIMLELNGEYYDVVHFLHSIRAYVTLICSLFDRFFQVVTAQIESS